MRSRSMSIFAESEDDFNSQFDETRRRRRKRISQEDEYDITSEEDDYSTLTDLSPESTLSMFLDNPSYNCDQEEETEDDFILKQEDLTKPHTLEEGTALLCEYLHNTLRNTTKRSSNLLFKKKSNLPSVMSHNAIYSIDTNLIISSLLSACEFPFNNEEAKYENIIIMLLSNVSSEKNKMVSKLINSETASIETRPFDIINYRMSLFNRNVMIEFFNTENAFHQNKMAAIYYTLSHCYLFIIDSSINNAAEFLEENYRKIANYSTNKTFVLLDINPCKGFKNSKKQSNIKSLSGKYGMIYLTIHASECSINNEIIQNLFKLIFIKKINTKTFGNNSSPLTSPKKPQDLSNKSNPSIKDSYPKQIENSLGYNTSYRLNHINSFDFNDKMPSKKRINEI